MPPVEDPVMQEVFLRLDAMGLKIDRTYSLLSESTPERGSVLDTQRKHAAEILALQGGSWMNFAVRAFLGCVICLATTGAAALMGEGVIVRILAQVSKAAVHP